MTFSVYFKVTLSLYQKHSVFCFIALPVTRTSPTVCPQQTTSGKCCSIPFKYRGVTFNSCTSADYHRPWCSLDPVYKERWGYCSKFNLTLVCISKLHYHYSGALVREARSGAPWVRKCGNLPIWENLVITWPYARPSVRTTGLPM